MGYRHTFYIVEKENLNSIIHEEIESYKNKEYFHKYDFMEAKGFKEINELGKYSNEGYYLSKSDLIMDYPDLKELRSLLYDEGDTEFYFMKPEALLKVAEMYHEKNVKYWEMLLSDEPIETYDSVETEIGSNYLNLAEISYNDFAAKYSAEETRDTIYVYIRE